MEGWLAYIVSLIMMGFLGKWIINKMIATDQKISSYGDLFVFCITFSLSVVSLELIIFDIMGVGSMDGRKLIWKVNLSLLVILCIYFVPAVIIGKLILRIGPPKLQIFLRILFGMAFIYAILNYIGIEKLQNLTFYIDEITIIGSRLIAILSGFGAVNCPFAYFQFISLDVKKVKLLKLEIVSNIYFILGEIEKLTVNIAILENQRKTSSVLKNNNYTEKGFFKKMFGFLFSEKEEANSIRKQIDDLQNELIQLKEIHKDFFEYYKEYAQEEHRHTFSNTLQGRFFKKLAWAVSIYCVYKIIMSIINSLIGRRKSMDPINRILKIILPFFGFTLDQETYETLSMYGTFVFMGYLMISNVRSFTLNLANIVNSVTGNKILQKIPQFVLVYFLAEVFGIYLISTVVLLQTSLPDNYLTNLKEITSQIDILAHYLCVDKYFLFSSLISFLVIFVNHHQRNQKLKNFKDED